MTMSEHFSSSGRQLYCLFMDLLLLAFDPIYCYGVGEEFWRSDTRRMDI